METLIVGGAGEVGRYLVRDLSHKDCNITVLDRAPKDPETAEIPSVNYLQGDVADEGLVNEVVRGKDVVIHLAWSFSDDPRTVFSEDIKGHINLLEAASSCGVRSFIYTSTAVVYGRAVAHPINENHPCIVADARKPLYALGKYAAEELCKLYHKSKQLPVTVFRFWWAFGATIGGRHLRELVKKALRNEPLEMARGAGGAFVTMADLADAIGLAIDRPAAFGQVYNVGSLFLSWEEIGTMIAQATSSSSNICLVPSDEWNGPAFLNEIWDLSWGKAERELGYKPGKSREQMCRTFEEALQECVNRVRKEM